MEGVFLGGSLIAAFLAGSVALFAPCCIVVLFPAYLAAAVRNSRWRLVPLTLVFAAGIAVVLIPITLGLGILTRGLLRYHSATYVAGGILMLVLAGLALSGRGWTLPIMRGSPDVQRTDSGGVFVLGVFSGAASACCAPVLAGVLTLSAVAPTLIQGVGIGLAYVFGMVFPLVLLALAWDRLGPKGRDQLRGKERRLRLAGRTLTVTTLDLVAASMFSAMGVALVVIGMTGTTLAPTAQVTIGTWLQDRLAPLVGWLDPVSDVVIGLALVGVAAAAVAISGRRRKPDTLDESASGGDCHEQKHETAETVGHTGQGER
ncbi:MAG: cytochrome c biogenesis CcdA family protein [Actinomycetia bacterium]|nr:cytochrome c biogenesis CcdA family protein [Actinomycetes bacterium]